MGVAAIGAVTCAGLGVVVDVGAVGAIVVGFDDISFGLACSLFGTCVGGMCAVAATIAAAVGGVEVLALLLSVIVSSTCFICFNTCN